MIVSKFGGSITASAEGLMRAAEIIRSNPERCYIIVSAPGKTFSGTGVTDILYMCHSAFHKREDFSGMLDTIAGIFTAITDGLGMKYDIEPEISALKNDLTAGKSLDHIGSRGEYIMGKIIAQFLGWKFVDAAGIISFNNNGEIDTAKTFRNAREKLSGLSHAVIPTFYGTMPNGEIKTFQRGNGDSSGALIARGVGASLFEKWSDSAMTYSAEPSVVPDSRVIHNLTYSEAVGLNYIGVRVISDNVIFMLRDAGIPIRICGIYDGGEGLTISAEIPRNVSRSNAVCIAGRKGYDVIHIEKYGLNKIYGFGEKLFGLFAKYRVACEHCLSGIYKMSVVIKTPMFDIRRNEILSELQSVIEPEQMRVERKLSLITVVGEGIGADKDMFRRIFTALSQAGIRVRMIDQGSDDLSVIAGVSDEDYVKAVNALYRSVIFDVGACNSDS